MSDVDNLVLPILQKLQQDMSGVRASLLEVKEAVFNNGEKLDTIESYMTYHMGITLQHKADMEIIHDEISNLKKRVAELEAQH
jgi:polyhydroxyalkanoate synthesis regulator phasin